MRRLLSLSLFLFFSTSSAYAKIPDFHTEKEIKFSPGAATQNFNDSSSYNERLYTFYAIDSNEYKDQYNVYYKYYPSLGDPNSWSSAHKLSVSSSTGSGSLITDGSPHLVKFGENVYAFFPHQKIDKEFFDLKYMTILPSISLDGGITFAQNAPNYLLDDNSNNEILMSMRKISSFVDNDYLYLSVLGGTLNPEHLTNTVGLVRCSKASSSEQEFLVECIRSNITSSDGTLLKSNMPGILFRSPARTDGLFLISHERGSKGVLKACFLPYKEDRISLTSQCESGSEKTLVYKNENAYHTIHSSEILPTISYVNDIPVLSYVPKENDHKLRHLIASSEAPYIWDKTYDTDITTAGEHSLSSVSFEDGSDAMIFLKEQKTQQGISVKFKP